MKTTRHWVVINVLKLSERIVYFTVVATQDTREMRDDLAFISTDLEELLSREISKDSLPKLGGLWLAWIDTQDREDGWKVVSEWRRLHADELRALAAGELRVVHEDGPAVANSDAPGIAAHVAGSRAVHA